MAFGALLRRILSKGGTGGFLVQVIPPHHAALACPVPYCISVGTLPVVAIQHIRQLITLSEKREISTSKRLADSLRHSPADGNPQLHVKGSHSAEVRFVQSYSQPPRSAEKPPVGALRRVWTRVAGQVKAFMVGTRSLYKDVKRVWELEKRKGKLVIHRNAPDGMRGETGEKRFPFSREEVQFIITVGFYISTMLLNLGGSTLYYLLSMKVTDVSQSLSAYVHGLCMHAPDHKEGYTEVILLLFCLSRLRGRCGECFQLFSYSGFQFLDTQFPSLRELHYPMCFL